MISILRLVFKWGFDVQYIMYYKKIIGSLSWDEISKYLTVVVEVRHNTNILSGFFNWVTNVKPAWLVTCYACPAFRWIKNDAVECSMINQIYLCFYRVSCKYSEKRQFYEMESRNLKKKPIDYITKSLSQSWTSAHIWLCFRRSCFEILRAKIHRIRTYYEQRNLIVDLIMRTFFLNHTN